MDYTKQLIRQSFNKYSLSYDNHSIVQTKAAKNLGALLEGGYSPLVLDLGCGNGCSSNIMLRKHRYDGFIAIDIADQSLGEMDKKITPICADIDNIPIAPEVVDMVVSNMSFQWLQNLERAFLEIHRILKSRGWLVFSMPIEGSFESVKNFCSNSFNELYSLSYITQVLKESKLSIEKMDVQKYSAKFPDLLAALKSIRNIGAGVSLGKKNFRAGLTKDKVLQAKKFFGNSLVPLDYKVLYIIAEKV